MFCGFDFSIYFVPQDRQERFRWLDAKSKNYKKNSHPEYCKLVLNETLLSVLQLFWRLENPVTRSCAIFLITLLYRTVICAIRRPTLRKHAGFCTDVSDSE